MPNNSIISSLSAGGQLTVDYSSKSAYQSSSSSRNTNRGDNKRRQRHKQQQLNQQQRRQRLAHIFIFCAISIVLTISIVVSFRHDPNQQQQQQQYTYATTPRKNEHQTILPEYGDPLDLPPFIIDETPAIKPDGHAFMTNNKASKVPTIENNDKNILRGSALTKKKKKKNLLYKLLYNPNQIRDSDDESKFFPKHPKQPVQEEEEEVKRTQKHKDLSVSIISDLPLALMTPKISTATKDEEEINIQPQEQRINKSNTPVESSSPKQQKRESLPFKGLYKTSQEVDYPKRLSMSLSRQEKVEEEDSNASNMADSLVQWSRNK